MVIKNALIVDDSRSARLVLQRLLTRLHMNVEAVESAEAAFEFLEHQQPDIIFMDHMMPGMDGLEATQVIRSNPKTSAIPTIMYTSKEGEDYFRIARQSGADGVLPKPANQEAIMAVIQSLDKPAANDEAQAKPATDIPLIEIDRIIQKHLKLAITEAKSEVTAGLDLTTSQLQQHQKHQLEVIQRQLQKQVEALRSEFGKELEPQQMFRKTQAHNQRLAVAVAEKVCRKTADDLTTNNNIQRVALESLITDQKLELQILIRSTAIRAAFAGASIGVLASILASILL